MNTFCCSDGTRVRKSVIDRRVHAAKLEKLMDQEYEYGYNFCSECQRNDDKPLDVSHIISVDEAQKSGRAELAWDKNNMRVLGRSCHRNHDKTYIGGPA
jgi:5-methylcytosine-specific restriction endonuclease McrA